MVSPWDQNPYAVRLDWGLRGALELLGGGAGTAVVVDVLSFTTSVTVAVERGIAVRPHRWKGSTAEDLAERLGAVAAVQRSAGSATQPSLSPASIAAAQGVSRLILPSPNGSTICDELDARGVTVVAASLRNAGAVGAWLAERWHDLGPLAVIAAGERWSGDDSLRPAVEDLWGAGAVISALAARVSTADLSPEAEVARAAYAAVSGELATRLRTCASGRELVDRRFGEDVEIAAQVGASEVVPVLRYGWFVA